MAIIAPPAVLPPPYAAQTAYELRELPIGDILIDHTYQRAIRALKLEQIVAAYDPLAAGTLIVSLRAGGQYVVIDGQHRLLAARRVGRQTHPALVIFGLAIDDEAHLFRYYNANRSAVRSHEMFAVLLREGDPRAQQVVTAVTDQNFRLGTVISDRAPRTLLCYSDLLAIVERGDRLYNGQGAAILRTTLKIIDDAWDADPQVLRGPILQAVAQFHATLSYPPTARYSAAEAVAKWRRVLPSTTLAQALQSKRLGSLATPGQRARGPMYILLDLLLAMYNHARQAHTRLNIVFQPTGRTIAVVPVE